MGNLFSKGRPTLVSYVDVKVLDPTGYLCIAVLNCIALPYEYAKG